MCFLLPLKKDKNVWHLQAVSSFGDPRLSCLLPSQWLLGSLHSFFQPEKQKCKSVNNLACTVLWTKRKTDTQHSCLQKVSSVTTVVAKEAGNVILLLIILLINRIINSRITFPASFATTVVTELTFCKQECCVSVLRFVHKTVHAKLLTLLHFCFSGWKKEWSDPRSHWEGNRQESRGSPKEETACKCQTFLSFLSGRRKHTSDMFSFSIQI